MRLQHIRYRYISRRQKLNSISAAVAFGSLAVSITMYIVSLWFRIDPLVWMIAGAVFYLGATVALVTIILDAAEGLRSVRRKP
jgi:hypothetical protein